MEVALSEDPKTAARQFFQILLSSLQGDGDSNETNTDEIREKSVPSSQDGQCTEAVKETPDHNERK